MQCNTIHASWNIWTCHFMFSGTFDWCLAGNLGHLTWVRLRTPAARAVLPSPSSVCNVQVFINYYCDEMEGEYLLVLLRQPGKLPLLFFDFQFQMPGDLLHAQLEAQMFNILFVGWRGGSIGIASDSRFKDWKKKLWEFFQVKNVVLTRCRYAQPPCVFRHAYNYKWCRTHVEDSVVHVRVWWITETWKDRACTCRTW